MTSSLTNPPLGRDLAAAAQEPASQTRVVAGSLATGLVAALLLVAAPFTPRPARTPSLARSCADSRWAVSTTPENWRDEGAGPPLLVTVTLA